MLGVDVRSNWGVEGSSVRNTPIELGRPDTQRLCKTGSRANPFQQDRVGRTSTDFKNPDVNRMGSASSADMGRRDGCAACDAAGPHRLGLAGGFLSRRVAAGVHFA